MKKTIKLKESDLIKIVKRIIIESDKKNGSKDEWEYVWHDLRKQSKSFGSDDGNVFTFGGLFFHLSKNGYLRLPPQKLSDWRDDLGKAADILDDYVKRLKKHLNDSKYNLKLEVGDDFEMKIFLND